MFISEYQSKRNTHEPEARTWDFRKTVLQKPRREEEKSKEYLNLGLGQFIQLQFIHSLLEDVSEEFKLISQQTKKYVYRLSYILHHMLRRGFQNSVITLLRIYRKNFYSVRQYWMPESSRGSFNSILIGATKVGKSKLRSLVKSQLNAHFKYGNAFLSSQNKFSDEHTSSCKV